VGATAADHFRAEKFLWHSANAARDTAASQCIAPGAVPGCGSRRNTADHTNSGNEYACSADGSGPPTVRHHGWCVH
jgi:hypothetical protein